MVSHSFNHYELSLVFLLKMYSKSILPNWTLLGHNAEVGQKWPVTDHNLELYIIICATNTSQGSSRKIHTSQRTRMTYSSHEIWLQLKVQVHNKQPLYHLFTETSESYCYYRKIQLTNIWIANNAVGSLIYSYDWLCLKGLSKDK